MNQQMLFEWVWELLCGELVSSQEVFNWTGDKSHFGENFAAQWEGSHILCTLPSSREIRVPQDDFESLQNVARLRQGANSTQKHTRCDLSFKIHYQHSSPVYWRK